MKKLVMDLPEINDYRMVEGLNQLKTNLAFCGKDIKVINDKQCSERRKEFCFSEPFKNTCRKWKEDTDGGC